MFLLFGFVTITRIVIRVIENSGNLYPTFLITLVERLFAHCTFWCCCVFQIRLNNNAITNDHMASSYSSLESFSLRWPQSKINYFYSRPLKEGKSDVGEIKIWIKKLSVDGGAKFINAFHLTWIKSFSQAGLWSFFGEHLLNSKPLFSVLKSSYERESWPQTFLIYAR